MSLKPDRQEHLTDLSFFMNEVSERGLIVSHSTGGSGAAMDDSSAVVQVVTATNENPAGVLCAVCCCSLQATLQPASNSSTKPDGFIKFKKSHQQSFEFRKKIETKKSFGQQKPL